METQTILNIVLLVLLSFGELLGVFATIMTIKDEPENIGFIACGAMMAAFGYGIYILIPFVQI